MGGSLGLHANFLRALDQERGGGGQGKEREDVRTGNTLTTKESKKAFVYTKELLSFLSFLGRV